MDSEKIELALEFEMNQEVRMRLRCQLGQAYAMQGQFVPAYTQITLCIEYFRDKKDVRQLARGRLLLAMTYANNQSILTAKTLLDIHFLNSDINDLPEQDRARVHALHLLLQLILQQPGAFDPSLQSLSPSTIKLFTADTQARLLGIKAIVASYQRRNRQVLEFLQQAKTIAENVRLKSALTLWWQFEWFRGNDKLPIQISDTNIARQELDKKYYRLFNEVQSVINGEGELPNRNYFADSLYQRLLLENYAYDLIEQVSEPTDNRNSMAFSVDLLEKVKPYEIISSANELLEADLTASNELREKASVEKLTRTVGDHQQFFAFAYGIFLVILLLIVMVLLRKNRQNTLFEQRIRITRQQLEKHFRFDTLTKAYNGEWALQILTTEIEQKNLINAEVNLMLLKIEGLARANQTKGRSFGDNVLCRFTGELKRTIRQQDFLARWSGDEFLLYCPDTDVSGYQIVAEKILSRSWVTEVHDQAKQLNLGVSAAIVTVAQGEAFAEAISRLKDGLFQCGELGGKQIVFN